MANMNSLKKLNFYSSIFSVVIAAGLMDMMVSGCDKASEKLTEEALPIVATLETTGISGTTAVSGGKVLSAGSVPLTARGVCWNRQGHPTVNDSKTNDGTGTGTFTSTITGLEEATTYVARAYAVNSVGIGYGSPEVFTTSTIPIVTTSEATDVTGSSAISGGTVVFCGGASVTLRGVCWSQSENPTITDSRTLDGKNVGLFKSTVTGLSSNSTYYVRAYATNSIGTAYGNQISFTTH